MDDIETTAREQMNAGSAKERLMKAIIGGIFVGVCPEKSEV